ncbi:hypothetical protein FISHEDRAFT_65631 [Fistulina hepatica ATCC 64428]|uniref:Uncharacterized protein n=1 Tax=Fistulina hepatica ATCC 64428 TaxID=1128425 RepID=A0A0D7ACZ1_9AGAR|nr:hypothetical protein FISHEDRAFT_65631 [Fistulina hepatica ATCC 64428]
MDADEFQADLNDILGVWGTNGNTQKLGKEINLLAEMLRNDKADDASEDQPFCGFSEVSVHIPLPSGNRPQCGEGLTEPQLVEVPSLYRCKLVPLIQDVFTQPSADKFHFTPYRLFHEIPVTAADTPEAKHAEHIYGELYESEEFILEHDRVQQLDLHPDDAGCKLEHVVAALMFWSDSTHLADFGTAKMWPIYMFLGNLSKYEHAKPTSGACHHLAYIPSPPDSFQDIVKTHYAKWDTQKGDITTHCHRELFHTVWEHLLDNDFLHVYQYGMHRVYPRIFTYSADYPEKVLLATICDKGLCLCPQCLVPKQNADLMGQVNDMKQQQSKTRKYAKESVDATCDWIYCLGYGICSTAVEAVLKLTSSVPTQNAFAKHLNIEPANIPVVDLMHEFKLGVWKALFTHLICLLYVAEPHGSLIETLDERFWQIPTFSVDTICQFSNNVSAMKKLTAWDFEDMLQVSRYSSSLSSD